MCLFTTYKHAIPYFQLLPTIIMFMFKHPSSLQNGLVRVNAKVLLVQEVMNLKWEREVIDVKIIPEVGSMEKKCLYRG